MLWGPFLALGLYDLSLRREHGGRFFAVHDGVRRNPVNLLLYSAMLGVLVLLWLRMSSIVLVFSCKIRRWQQHSYLGFSGTAFRVKNGLAVHAVVHVGD